MNTHKSSKINRLLQAWPNGTVAMQEWLSSQDISSDLAKQYVRSQWLERIGKGAFIKAGDYVDWAGGLYALQSQLNFTVHVGGKTALKLQGIQHFVNANVADVVWLFGNQKQTLPKWFVENKKWDSSNSQIKYVKTAFLGEGSLGLEQQRFSNSFEIVVSSLERAVMELLYLVPLQQTLVEAKYLIEGLMTMRPELLQHLLQRCNSIKVKRLFLFLADLCHLPCLEHLDLSKVDLGKGKRVIGEGGYYVSKHQISIPKNFANTFKEELEDVK